MNANTHNSIGALEHSSASADPRTITTRHTPERQCVGCREREPKDELLRVARRHTGLTIDPRSKLPGRGAYIHYRLACLERALKRGALFRALRIAQDASRATELRRELAAFLEGLVLPDTLCPSGRRTGAANGRVSHENPLAAISPSKDE